MNNLLTLLAAKMPAPDGNSAEQWVPFYHSWEKAGYLNFSGIWEIKAFGAVKNILLIFFYNIAVGMENIFNSSLRIFGIFDTINAEPLRTIRLTVFWLGIGLLAVSLMILAISQIFGKGEKYLKGIKSATIFTVVIILLPFVVSTVGGLAKSGASDIEGNGTSKSMAIQFINGNIVDVNRLAKNNFDYDPSMINPASDKLNDFKDESIGSVKFDEVVSKDTTKNISGGNGINAFKHYIISDSDGKDTVSDTDIPSDNKSGITKIFTPAYARYTGNYWIALFSLATLALFLVVMAFRVVKSCYQIIITVLVAPVILYTNLQKPSRVKDILSAISGAAIGVWSEVISVKVFMFVISTLDSNPAVKALHAGGLELGMMKLIILIGSMTGFLYGIQLIERWTGVPSGTGHGMLGFALGGTLAAKGAVAGVRGAATGANKLVDAIKGTKAASTSGTPYAHQLGANADPTKGIGKGDDKDKGTNASVNEANNQDKSELADDSNKGTNDSSVDAGNLDNGKTPIDGGDGEGTNDTAINSGNQDNGKSPVDRVDEQGTRDNALNSGNRDNGKSPVDVNKGSAKGQGTNSSSVDAGSRSATSADGTSEATISDSNISGSSTSSPAGTSPEPESSSRGVITNTELSKKLDSIGKHQEISDKRQKKIDKASRQSTFDKIQGVANTASRIRQETDEPGLGTPEDKDEF